MKMRPQIALASLVLLAGSVGPAGAARAEGDGAGESSGSAVRLSHLPRMAERHEALPSSDYDVYAFGGQVVSVAWEMAGIIAALTIKGAVTWKWGTASFAFNPEGWFGKDTGSFGMDKLGHAFSTYLLTELLTDRIRVGAPEPDGAPLTAAALASSVMLYVEMFDGFSVDHGFAYEDLVFNTMGASLSAVRNLVPGIRTKLDFRMEYVPSGNKRGFHPITDYSGQKYVLVLRLSGFELFEDTALQFAELHAGYFARGFTKAERERGEPERREPYLGIGLDLQQLLLGEERADDAPLVQYGRRLFEYYQIPYTYVARPQS